VPDLVDIIIDIGEVSNLEVLLDTIRAKTLNPVADRELLAIVIAVTIAILELKHGASFVHSFVQNLNHKAIFRL